jgi:hypothetical protein
VLGRSSEYIYIYQSAIQVRRCLCSSILATRGVHFVKNKLIKAALWPISVERQLSSCSSSLVLGNLSKQKNQLAKLHPASWRRRRSRARSWGGCGVRRSGRRESSISSECALPCSSAAGSLSQSVHIQNF